MRRLLLRRRWPGKKSSRKKRGAGSGDKEEEVVVLMPSMLPRPLLSSRPGRRDAWSREEEESQRASSRRASESERKSPRRVAEGGERERELRKKVVLNALHFEKRGRRGGSNGKRKRNLALTFFPSKQSKSKARRRRKQTKNDIASSPLFFTFFSRPGTTDRRMRLAESTRAVQESLNESEPERAKRQ